MLKLFPLVLLTLLITSCDEKKTIYVAPTLTDCEGVGKQKCMQIKEHKEDEWTLFYDQIEGFDYQEGYTYKLNVSISKVENPPADGSSLKYKLANVVYKEPVEEKVATAQTLSGTWKVVYMDGNISFAKQPTMSFKNGQISGNAACNNYNAKVEIHENAISIGLAMATKMYCTNMKIEKLFFDCLNRVALFKIENEQLTLYDENNKELMICTKSND